MTGLLTTPLDVVKTRLMTQGNKQIYKGVFDCVSKISKEEGASTLLQASLHAHHRSAPLPLAADLPASRLERAAQAVCHRAAPCRSVGSIIRGTVGGWHRMQSRRLSDLLPIQGWQPRVTWIALGGCVFFTALEEAKKLYAPQKWKDNK